MKHRPWRILALALIMFLYGFGALFSVSAQVYSGNAAASFASGSGTQSDPYVIKNADQLACLAKQTSMGNSFNNKYFVLENDVVLNDESFVFDCDTGLVKVSDGKNTAYLGTGIKGDGSKNNTVFDSIASEIGVWYASDTSKTKGSYGGTLNNWTPIGGKDTRFEGNFDGKGHTIGGMYVNTPLDYGGLFGCANATLENIRIGNSYIRSGEYTGSVAGQNSYLTKGCVADAVVSSDKSYVGGVVGSGSTVTDSVSACTVLASQYVGGIAGKAKVEGCCNIGNVFGGIYVGGIAGEGKGSNNVNTASVVGTESVGGICGVLGQNMSDPKIATSYNTGAVNGEKYVGAVVGRLVNGSAVSCYYLEGTAVDFSNKPQNGVGTASGGSSQSDTSGATAALDESQIKQKESFAGFDFENAWSVSSSGIPMPASLSADPHTHTYDNACDEACNVCGETREVVHNYKSTLSSDKNSHWRECSICSDKKDIELHSFSNALTKDTTGHWYACVCGAKQSFSSHRYDNACDNVCNDCAWVRVTTHSYGDVLSKDSTDHWYECACGDRREVEGHKYDNSCDTDCNVCAYERAVIHTFSDIKKYDDSCHWQECEICKTRGEASPHVWDSGTVTKEPTKSEEGIKTYKCTECAYTKNEPIDKLAADTTTAVTTTDTPVTTTDANTSVTAGPTQSTTTTASPETTPSTEYRTNGSQGDDGYLGLAIALGITSAVLLAALIVMLIYVWKKKDK